MIVRPFAFRVAFTAAALTRAVAADSAARTALRPAVPPAISLPAASTEATPNLSQRLRAGTVGTPASPTSSTQKQTAITLPPMIVSGGNARPWLYVKVGNAEYLSRCSVATTTAFVKAELEIERMLHVFVPPDMLPTDTTPSVSILSPLEPGPMRDEVMNREFQEMEARARRAAPPAGRRPGTGSSAGVQPGFLPNLRLEDRDMRAVFTEVEEKDFRGNDLLAAPEYVDARLLARTPTLPEWLLFGLSRLYRKSSFRTNPITVQPIPWVLVSDTAGLINDATSRRVMLPVNEFFAANALTEPDHNHPARIATWRVQSVLFVRWALDPANAPAAESLWKLVRRISREPITESVFRECFGFGYADLQGRLSDYLPIAVRQSMRIQPGSLAGVPGFEVQAATEVQIARMRGEWERLEIPFVRRQHPEFLEHYIERAQTTLRRAVGEGLRSPELFAALGLCELDAGNPTAARPYLEQAAAERVVRPRVYYELARLRWLDLTRDAAATEKFSAAAIEPVLQRLRIAATQSPALPEVYFLMADAWLRCRDRISTEDLERLVAGTPLFRRIPGVGYRVALLQVRAGRRSEAEHLLRIGLEFAGEPEIRAQLQELLSSITRPAANE